MQELKVRYYENELEDDFAENNGNIEKVKIDKKYKYLHKNIFWKIGSFIIYRLVFLVPATIYSKIKFGLKIEGKRIIRAYRKQNKNGFFLYQNHTQEILDTFLPTLVSFPTKAFIIANSDNVSIKGLKTANKMMGALPLPEDKESTKNFLEAINYHLEKGKAISIYPEAHVWPYYTKIRNFKSAAFKYPVKQNVAAFAVTTTYQKNKKGKAKVVLYIDGPFMPEIDLPLKQAQEKLRDTIYNKMVERSKLSNIEVVKYEKKEKKI